MQPVMTTISGGSASSSTTVIHLHYYLDPSMMKDITKEDLIKLLGKDAGKKKLSERQQLRRKKYNKTKRERKKKKEMQAINKSGHEILILFVQNQNLASLPPAQQICISRALLSGPFWGVYDQVKTPRKKLTSCCYQSFL
jgi:hypothetical protein